jgi:hypothetical protein
LIRLTGTEHQYVSTADDDLHMKIVEMYWSANKWNLLRVRHDKDDLVNRGLTYGNNHYVAEKIWLYMMNDIKVDELYDFKSMGYFAKKKGT